VKINAKAQESATKILEAFQDPEALPKALAPIFIHRNDDTPCRKWSFRNQFLAALAGTQDARGYKQWQAVDHQVKKGSKAFSILGPCTKKVKDKDTGEDRYAVYGFKAISVFRIEDTEGPDIPSGDPELDSCIANLPFRDVAESWDITVNTFDGEGTPYLGFFRQTKDGENKAIAIGVKNAEVFLHELMHAADHRLGNAVEKGQHWRKEIVAELGSAILAECLQLTQAENLGGAYRYVEGYAKDSEKSLQAACIECLDRICKAVTLVLDTAEGLKDSKETVAA